MNGMTDDLINLMFLFWLTVAFGVAVLIAHAMVKYFRSWDDEDDK